MSAQQAISAQQPYDASGGVDLNLPVRATLDPAHPTPVTWLYARAKHVLQPGIPTFVPYMAMVYWQGDPRAIDMPGGRQHEQHRRLQREHLRVLYGVYENDERWADIPTVTCTPIDSDVPFETVLRDPDGLSLAGTTESNNQLAFMQAEMERMAQSMRVMQGQIAVQKQQEAALEAADLDPADLDRQETSTRVATPEEATGASMVGPSPQRRAPAPKGPATAAAAVTRDGE